MKTAKGRITDMYRSKENALTESKCIRNGIGETHMTKILNGADEMYGKGRMFNIMVIDPGNSIGEHYHTGDNEIFYFLSGTGVYNDNGTEVRVGPGDTVVCNDGEKHSLRNDGDEPLRFIALILF
jgi:mannose-6-phosphate isomerase-like protein (cupin superfamily)